MRKRWLIIPMALVLVMVMVPGAFAQNTEIIDGNNGNNFPNYQKTQQAIADRYNATNDIFEDAPGYQSLFQTQQVTNAKGGILKQSYLNRILAGINYYRWLYGVPEIASISTNQDIADFSLAQAHMVREGTGIAHEPKVKPVGLSGMTTTRWRQISGSNALKFHNIIVGTNRGNNVGTPATGYYGVAVRYWINEGTTADITGGKKVIGHREAVLDPTHNKASFGAATVTYEKDRNGERWYWVAEGEVGYVTNDGRPVHRDQDFYAMPAPGNFPYNDLTYGDAAWTVYLNPDIFAAGQNKLGKVYVTNPAGVQARAVNTSNQVEYASYYTQTLTFEPTNVSSFAPGDYQVEIVGIRKKNGTPVTIKYTVHLFDRNNPQPDPEEVTIGDVDNDGFITAYDASLILQYVAHNISDNDLEVGVADVDGDGMITAYDASLILQRVANNIDFFPVE